MRGAMGSRVLLPLRAMLFMPPSRALWSFVHQIDTLPFVPHVGCKDFVYFNNGEVDSRVQIIDDFGTGMAWLR